MLSTERFTDRVDFYTAARPSYPAALLRFFQNELGLSPTTPVADIGSGTGLLTEPFVRNGNPTFAVEPNAAMRHAAEQRLGEWANFHSIDATAEATTLADASVQLVTAGQAFHWFDPVKTRVEFHRILTPGGHAALVWNERVADRSPFMRGHHAMLERFQSGRKAEAADADTNRFDAFFGAGRYRTHSFDNPQLLDRQGLLDQIRSSSFTPLPPHVDHDRLMRAADELFDTHHANGVVQIEHDTRLFVGPI